MIYNENGTILNESNNIINKIKSGNVDEDDLLEYITDNDIAVAIAAAESKYATEPILDIAAHDNDKTVRMAALKNSNIGINTLKFLCKDSDPEIANTAKLYLEKRKNK